VIGAPYTTETELEAQDEFIIVACDGLWDVCDDNTAVQLIRDEPDPARASQMLVDHALENFSSDNLTCMVIRLGS
jgi:protein phosphatase PTC1